MDTNNTDGLGSKAEAFEVADDIPNNPLTAPTIGEVVASRFGRREMMKGALGVTAITAVAGPMALGSRDAKAQEGASRYVFDEISHGVDETHHVADGYDANVLLRWGDPIMEGAPEFDPAAQTPESQEMQFGYNNDFVGFVGLNDAGEMDLSVSDHGLLCVNHEYTNEEIMFPGIGRQDNVGFTGMTPDLIDIEMSAHGGSIVEIRKDGEAWSVVQDSPFNRRISARTTYMELVGPAAGHDRMKTSVDPTGRTVIGTINNCAGGITPWGTYLMAEENFHGYFWGDLSGGHPEARNYARYGVPGGWYAWGREHKRFDINVEPNEANRFGWVVEVDPMDPNSVPRKLTALGRFKHEGAESIINQDGRVVVYMGDDQRFDYVYKFVSERRYNPDDRGANMGILETGTLYVARFNDDGSLDWLPLIYGQGPLTAENGFHSQGDVLIETRVAADLLGATPMDRPEDVEPNPATNNVYVMLTNNSRRGADAVDGPNPRAENIWGQIVEIIPPNGDHDATTARWEILIQAGDPSVAEVGAVWNPATSENGFFACPDNCAIDHQGRLWISTDQGSAWSRASGTADGVWALETEGEGRGTGKMFFRVPVGAEMCGPRFTPDDTTLFVAVQHPATDGTRDYPGFERNSTFEDPATRWPDFQDDVPPRPSVVAITKQGGGSIAS